MSIAIKRVREQWVFRRNIGWRKKAVVAEEITLAFKPVDHHSNGVGTAVSGVSVSNGGDCRKRSSLVYSKHRIVGRVFDLGIIDASICCVDSRLGFVGLFNALCERADVRIKFMERKRVFITGLGIVSGIGNDLNNVTIAYARSSTVFDLFLRIPLMKTMTAEQ